MRGLICTHDVVLESVLAGACSDQFFLKQISIDGELGGWARNKKRYIVRYSLGGMLGMATRIMLVPNPADSFSVNLAACLPNVSELSPDLVVTDQFEDADLILFVDSYTDPSYRFIRHHPLIARHSQKCFLFSQLDDPIHVLPGTYANLDRRHHVPGWSS